MSVKEILTDAKTWVVIGIFILAFTANILGVIEIPKRLTTVEAVAGENRSSVDKLADTVEDYIQVQQQSWEFHEKIHAEGEKRTELLQQLIVEVRGEDTN